MKMKRAVVLLSGGMDSATVLAMARAKGYVCYALSVDYGQRHHAELAAAQRVAQTLGAQEHRVVKVDLTGFGGSALTDEKIAVSQQPTELRHMVSPRFCQTHREFSVPSVPPIVRITVASRDRLECRVNPFLGLSHHVQSWWIRIALVLPLFLGMHLCKCGSFAPFHFLRHIAQFHPLNHTAQLLSDG